MLSRFFLLVKTVAMFGWLFCFANTGTAQPSSPLKAELLPLHEPRPRSLDIQHIALDLRFDFAKRQAHGMAEITLSPLKATNEIALDAGFLDIKSISLLNLEGLVNLDYTYPGGDQNDNLRIKLPRQFAAGEKITLRIAYHTNYHNDADPNNLWGSYGKGLRFFSPTSTEPRKRRQIWSMGEPHGNRYWFPGWDAPGDARSCELRLTVPKPLTAISVGELVSKTENPDGTTSFHWTMDTPHFNHQTAFVVGEYVDVAQLSHQGAGGLELHSYCYPDEREATEATVVRLPDMLRFFEETTGVKYPYSTYNQVFVQDFPWGGGHNIGTSTISENMVDDHGTHADFFYLWDGVEAQDLAAQWFGNLLTPADWSEVWLSKSFALYLDCLFTEYKNGHDEMLLWNRNFQHTTVMGDWQSGIKRPIVTRHYDDPATMCFDNFALRGAMVLHLLRKELGEKKWQKAIQLYVKNNAGKAVTTADFQTAVEAAAGRPMGWFFEQWLYKTGHPVFEVAKQYDAEKRQLALTVKQLQQHDLPPNPLKGEFPQVGFFQGKIEVEIDGKVEQIRLEPKAENLFTFKAETEPKLVNFDFESTWIKELVFEKTSEEWLHQFLHSRDVVARRAAMFELANFYKKEGTTPAQRTEVEAAFRSVISGDAFWRLRNSAMGGLQGLVGGKPLDEATETLLLGIVKNEKSWLRSTTIGFLGSTLDPKYADLYLAHFNDESDRVVNAAANALGKCKAAGAYEALLKLKDKPSWKNQSLISALNGLRELGDPRAADLALAALRDDHAGARWTLATSVWDYRLAAAETLVALGKAGEGYPIVYQRFTKAMAEDDVNDIFSNVLLMATLGDGRALEVFPALREKFKEDANVMRAVEGFEGQLREISK